jgi:hypothetical protein
MARWTAKCWLGSRSGYQDCEVSASSAAGAQDQLERIYGAEQIVNLRQVGNGGLFSGSSSSGGSSGGSLSALMWLAALFVFISYWQIILPIAAIILIIKLIFWFRSL